MEYVVNNFGFLVLGFALAACLFFGFIAWLKVTLRKRRDGKESDHRKGEMMQRVVQKTLVKNIKEKDNLSESRVSSRTSSPASSSNVHSTHSQYDNGYRSYAPAYAVSNDDDDCNRRHSSHSDSSPSYSSHSSSSSSDSCSSSSDSGSSSSSSCD